MNAQVPAVPKPQIVTGGQVAALVPQTLDEAFRVSQAIAASNLAPRGLEKPEQILVAIMAGAELGFAPFQALQSFAVVNGRPTLWGDGLVAIVRRNGCQIREWHEGETAYCEVTRPDTGETIMRSFSQGDAAKAGLSGKTGPWQQYPQRMRAMRARAWAVRVGCADMLRGFQVAEEVDDYPTTRPTAPESTGLHARLTAGKPSGSGEGFNTAIDGETGEVRDLDEVLEGDQIPTVGPVIMDAVVEEATQPATPTETENRAPEATLAQRATFYENRLRGAATTLKLTNLRGVAENLRNELDSADPERLVELEDLFNARFAELDEAEKASA